MRRFLPLLLPLVLMAPLTLGACKKAATAQYSDEKPSMPAAASDASSADVDHADPPAPAVKPPLPDAPPAAAPTNLPMLAYSYEYGVEAAPTKIRDLVAHQKSACDAAGAPSCEVTGEDLSQSGPDAVTAKLTLKATPVWLKGYEDRLSQDAQASGGKLIHSAVTTEDLSREIVDTEAAVRAKTALRDRLQTLLQTQPGKLDDLVDLEAKVAEVQGDLDATSSELAAMQGRVATSDVTVEYDSGGVLAPQGAWAPVGKAVGSIAEIFGGTIAAMVYILAFAFPWAVLIGGGLWLFRKRLFRRKPKAAPAPLSPPATPGGDKA